MTYMGEKPLRFLVMSLTGRCNLACEYCYATNQAKDDMSFDTAKTAIDFMSASGKRWTLQISGGEPLFEIDLLKEIVGYIRNSQLSVKIQLQTNGTLLTDKIAEFFSQNRIGVGVSLDGMPKINDLTRKYPDGTGASVSVLRGIEILKEHGIGTGLTAVITDKNVNSMTELIEFAYYLGNVRRIGFDLLRGQGRGKNFKPADSAALRNNFFEAYERAEELSKIFGYRIKFSQVEQAQTIYQMNNQGFAHCEAMNQTGAHMDSRGKLYACSSFVGDEAYCIGDVWQGIDYERWKKIATVIQNSLKKCRQCEELSLCGGACFARCAGNGNEPQLVECIMKNSAAMLAKKHFLVMK